MFGVRSPDLERAFDLPTVNLGVNAGLGTYEVPARVDKWIEPGDLVVMPLEYRLMLWDGVPSYVTLSWALEHPETLRRWSAKSLLRGLWSLPLKRVFEGYLSDGAMPRGLGPYGAHRLDQWGDQTRTAATFRSDAQLYAQLRPVGLIDAEGADDARVLQLADESHLSRHVVLMHHLTATTCRRDDFEVGLHHMHRLCVASRVLVPYDLEAYRREGALGKGDAVFGRQRVGRVGEQRAWR